VLAPSNFQNPPKIAQLLKSPPDDLQSKFRATYTSLLNLLDASGNFENVATSGGPEKRFRPFGIQRERFQLESKLKDVCNFKNKLEKSAFVFNRGRARLRQINGTRGFVCGELPHTRNDARRRWLEENVEAGRIVTKSRNGKRFFLVINVHGEKIAAMTEDGRGATLSLPHIGRVFEKKYPLKEVSIEAAFYEIHEGVNSPLVEPKLFAQKTTRTRRRKLSLR
jgi:hypothetical protein